MNRVRIRRITAALAGLASACPGMAAAAPAAFAQDVSSPSYQAMPTAWVREALLHGEDLGPVSGSGSAASPAARTVTRIVVVGGMPGWHIALIVAGAALLAAVAAVLLDRAWRPGAGRAAQSARPPARGPASRMKTGSSGTAGPRSSATTPT